MVVIQGKPDILKNDISSQQVSNISSDQLLDLNEIKLSSNADSDFLVSLEQEAFENPKPEAEAVELSEVTKVENPKATKEACPQDLLDSADDEAIKLSEAAMPIIPLVKYFLSRSGIKNS